MIRSNNIKLIKIVLVFNLLPSATMLYSEIFVVVVVAVDVDVAVNFELAALTMAVVVAVNLEIELYLVKELTKVVEC